MFPSLPKQWRPTLKNIASMIGPVLNDEEEIDRFNATQKNLPIVRVLGSRDSVLPSFIKLLALSKNTSGKDSNGCIFGPSQPMFFMWCGGSFS